MKKTQPYLIFLVEDNKTYLKTLKNYLNAHLKFNVSIKTFSNGEDCIKSLNLFPEIIILDYFLNEKTKDSKNGIEILKTIKNNNPEISVIILSVQDNMKVATDTMKYGAFDYVSKNENAFIRIQNAINNIYKYGLWLH
jgi:DNA-binding NarL/FixJ family response regulator